MGLHEILALALPIAHFVNTWVYVGAILFPTAGANVQGVGFGLFMIVALQFSGILFFLRNSSSKESFPTVLTIFWFAFVGGNMLFLIIIGVWAGNAYNHAEPRVAAAFAFSVFDFLVNGAMIALTFLNRSSSGGGGFQPPPEITP